MSDTISIPEGLVRALAAQFFIDRNKNLDGQDLEAVSSKLELDLKWKEDAAMWASMNDEERKPFTDSAKQYILDWVERYPRYASKVLNDWLEVDYSKP